MSDKDRKTIYRDQYLPGPNGKYFVRIWSPEEHGRGVPIFLFHDSLGSVELWRNFPAELCAKTGLQVIAYDRLGFGRSDANPAKLPLDFIAKEADCGFAVVRQQLSIGRFALFGHSVGGGMAINVAAKHGEDCVALITVSAQAFVEYKTIRGLEEARQLFKDHEQVSRLKKYHGEKAEWVLDAWIGSWLHPDFAGWSLRSVLPLVKCPLLVIHGIHDEYGTPRHPELIGELSGGKARVEILADTRHMPHREKEGIVVGMVAEFLRSVEL